MEADATSSPTYLLAPKSFLKDRWEALKKIGGGGFGEIYKAKDHLTNTACAVKVESCTSNKQVLKMEVAVLKRLQKSSSHVCNFMGCGRTDRINYLVMSLLGPSLSELRKHQPHQKFSISTTLRVGIQILSAVQSLHDCGFLHRDIKPSNFAVGSTPTTRRTCYMFDFGLARQYTTVTGEVRQPRQVAGFRGTVRYASLNAHLSRDLGRHDDLWSVFYLLVELAVGQLPWRRIRDKEEAGDVKGQFDHHKLLQCLPPELGLFLDHIKLLTYYDKPDYVYVAMTLKKAIARLGIQEADPFDWEQDLCGPSITSASAVSTPGVKVVSRDAVKRSVHKSRTNCSEVEGLIESNSMAANQPANQNIDGNVGSAAGPAAEKRILPDIEQASAKKATVDDGEEKAVVQNKNEDIMNKNVQIDNYYISEDSEEEEDGSSSQSSSLRESSKSDLESSKSNSPAPHDIHIDASVPGSQPVVKENQVISSLTSNSARSSDYQERVAIDIDGLKSKNKSDDLVQSVTTSSMSSSDRSKQQEDSYNGNKWDCAFPPAKDCPYVIHPEQDQPVLLGFSAPSANNDDLKNLEMDKEEKENLQSGGNNPVHHNVGHRTDSSSSSRSVGVSSTIRKMSSLPAQFNTMAITSETTETGANRNNDSGMHTTGTPLAISKDARGDANEQSNLYLDNADSNDKHDSSSKQTQGRKAVPPLKDNLVVVSSKTKPDKKNFPAKSKTVSSGSKISKEAGKLKARPGEPKGAHKLRSSEQVIHRLEVVPSSVILQPRPPPNPPPHHYSHTLQGRRRRFLRPQAEK